MRCSNILRRGAKGYGWYQQYVQKGQEGFRKHSPPSAFDWSNTSIERPKAFFDIKIGSTAVGRLAFEMAVDVVPKTVDNFIRLATGNSFQSRSYTGTKFHNVSKELFIMGGDVEHNDGTGSHSAYQYRYISDENTIIPHSQRGLLSMASVGRDTCGSQFYITLGPNPQMDGRCIVIGRVIGGEEVLSEIEKVFTFRGVPSNDVVIAASGMLSDS